MKVIVVGSLTGLSADAESSFKAACVELGKALGKRGHSIVACSDNDKHADPHVLQGFIQTAARGAAQQSVTVTFGDPADDENSPNKFQSEKRVSMSKLRWIEIDTSGEYPFNRIGVIKEADAVIMIGGREGTGYMSSVAFALEKTLVPLRHWIGQHRNVWDRLEAALKQDIGSKYFRYLSAPQSSSVDWDGVVEAVEILEKNKELRNDKHGIPAIGILGMQALGLAIWFTIFFTGGDGYYRDFNGPALIILLFISSIIGVTSRSALMLFIQNVQRVGTKRLLVEMCLGFSITFVAFVAGRGMLDFASSESGFRAAATTLSTMGFAVSFLLEMSVLRLNETIRSRVDLSGHQH